MAPELSTVAESQSSSRRRVAKLAVFASRRRLAMLALGFSAGLPAVLVFDVLSLSGCARPVSHSKPSASSALWGWPIR
jgi:hypothetical protein